MLDIDADDVIRDIDPWYRRWEADREAEQREASARAAAAKAAEQHLRDEEAEARRLIASSNPVDGYRRYVDVLARRHHLRVEWRTVMPAAVAAYAVPSRRTIVVPPITDEATFGIALHEAGHVLAGPCPKTEPHRPDPSVTAWWHCLACETLAWEAALRLAPGPFTRAMFSELQLALGVHRRQTPASPAAVAALEKLASSLTYADAVQARVKFSLKEDQSRRVLQDSERDALKTRIQRGEVLCQGCPGHRRATQVQGATRPMCEVCATESLVAAQKAQRDALRGRVDRQIADTRARRGAMRTARSSPLVCDTCRSDGTKTSITSCYLNDRHRVLCGPCFERVVGPPDRINGYSVTARRAMDAARAHGASS